jgi:hypothetical protein
MQPRNVSLLTPSTSPTRRHAAVMLPASSSMLDTRQIARSPSSSGHFLGAGKTPPSDWFGVSPKLGAIQTIARRLSSVPGPYAYRQRDWTFALRSSSLKQQGAAGWPA